MDESDSAQGALPVGRVISSDPYDPEFFEVFDYTDSAHLVETVYSPPVEIVTWSTPDGHVETTWDGNVPSVALDQWSILRAAQITRDYSDGKLVIVDPPVDAQRLRAMGRHPSGRLHSLARVDERSEPSSPEQPLSVRRGHVDQRVRDAWFARGLPSQNSGR